MNETLRHRVLIVDDEPTVCEACRRVLESDDFEAEVSDSAEAALRRITGPGKFSAAVVDLKLPGMDGIECVTRMRQLDDDIVAIVITGYATIESAVKAARQGAYGYLPKPFSPDELLQQLRQGIEKRAVAIEARRLRAERDRHLVDITFERSKCHTIINCIGDGILVANRDAQVVLQNTAAARVFSMHRASELPAPLESLQCPELAALLSQALQARNGKLVLTAEVALGPQTYMATASPVVSVWGDALGAVAVLRDITALKKLEEAKSMFVAMVAHEIKNPLAAVEEYLSVVLSDALSEDPAQQRVMIERAMGRARALRSMVSELTSLMAMDVGKFTLRRAPCDVQLVLQEALDYCEDQAVAKKIPIQISYAEDAKIPPALADRHAAVTVFRNIIDNAVKYTPDGGHVRIAVSAEKSFVRVAVSDDGIGMSPEEQAQVFEEFYRAKNEYTRTVPGTGLGLTLGKRIVEMHHGTIQVESAPGKGSTFIVRLPVA